MITLADYVVSRATLTIPETRCWWLDVELTSEVVLSGDVEFRAGGRVMLATVVDGGPSGGRSRYTLAGGARTLSKVTAVGFANDAGLSAMRMLQRIAPSVAFDETSFSGAAITARAAFDSQPIGDAISSIVGDWHVDDAGRVVRGKRFGGTLDLLVVDDDPRGYFTVAEEDVAQLNPGIALRGQLVRDVEITFDSAAIRARLTVDAPANVFRAAVLAAVPELRYCKLNEYRVTGQDGQSLHLTPVRAADGLPVLSHVPIRTDANGARAVWTVGALCLVGFAGGSPLRPYVLFGDALTTDAATPREVVQSVDDMQVSITNGLAEIAKVGETTDFPALAGLVKSHFDAVKMWLDNHTHPVATTGTASEQTGTAAAPSAPSPDVADPAAANVKVS